MHLPEEMKDRRLIIERHPVCTVERTEKGWSLSRAGRVTLHGPSDLADSEPAHANLTQPLQARFGVVMKFTNKEDGGNRQHQFQCLSLLPYPLLPCRFLIR